MVDVVKVVKVRKSLREDLKKSKMFGLKNLTDEELYSGKYTKEEIE